MADAAHPSPGWLPVCLPAGRAPCLIVGGGEVALRKARWLLEGGALVWAESTAFLPAFRELAAASDGRLELTEQAYAGPGRDLAGLLLVIAATDDPRVNRAVADDADAAGTPVNVVDAPARCTFLVPATVRRGGLCLAVNTGVPALSRSLREELAAQFPGCYAAYVAALAAIRDDLLGEPLDQRERARLLGRLASRDLRERILRDAPADLDAALREELHRARAGGAHGQEKDGDGARVPAPASSIPDVGRG